MKRNVLIIVCALGIAFYLFLNRPAPAPQRVESPPPAQQPTHKAPRPAVKTQPPAVVVSTPETRVQPQVVEKSKPEKPALHYKIKNGLIVVQGDVVAGAPRGNIPPTGLVEMPTLKLWSGGTIPYHIQPDLPDPQRVEQAIAMFEGTSLRFVPQNGEPDILVFEPGPKDCLSYVGKMGGNQPVWLSPNCGPTEIAHEIMHALGFVHEQNRSDRDNYLNVFFDNIEEDQIGNFEKLPEVFMKVTGLGEFDYQSIMMYPQWMFAKNGQSTMEPKDKNNLIQPDNRLSPGDIQRINRAYGGRAN